MAKLLNAPLESVTIRKISWRLLPLIVSGYCVAYIDRSNVAFAALTMNKDLGLTPYVYGMGAGIFFLGYFIFEVPSNIFMERVGARRWIARIMATWAIVSALAAFVTGPASFLTIRFLLGVAEAGFFPGVILYFTYWYPARYRARVISVLFLAQPLANGLASAASGALLGMDGIWGLKGWQWVFIIEALPALVLAGVVLKALTDRPALAEWLRPEEKAWLETELNEERRAVERSGKMSLWQALRDSRVLLLSLMYFLSISANYGIVFFLPQIVKGMGHSNLATGFAAATPYVIGIAGLVLWGWSSDRHNERRWHFITGAVTGGIGLAIAGWFGSSVLGLAGITIAVAGIYGSRTAFWPMPSLFLTGTAAVGAIAQINAIGNLGGYLGPFAVGWIKNSTNSFEAGLYFLAGCSLLSGIIAFFAVRISKIQG
jgi:ACS family tartrate transporter-like MFS transporter